MSTPGARTEGVNIEMDATSANMASHLASCGLKHRAALFESEGYTFEISLVAFTAGTLMDDLKELKLPLGERRKFFEQVKKSSTKSTRSSLYSSLCCTNILLTIVAVILFLYTAILVGVGSSIHATVGSMSSSLPSLKLPDSVVKLGTDILSADYQSLGDSAGGMAKAMDAMMPKDVHSDDAASVFEFFGDVAMYLNMIHSIIGDWQPPADAGVDTFNSPASDWGMLSYFFGGSPVDWMRKQVEPAEINEMGRACKQFARNIAKNKLYDWSMNTTRYEDLTKCDATLCGESRANGHCDRERYEYINGYTDPVTGSYINGYSKYYWGESRCPADRINASFSTDDAWQAVYTAYNITAWPGGYYLRFYRYPAGRFYTCCANGVGPGPHEVYGKRMKTDNPLSELGYHRKRTTLPWKQWVDQFVEDMEVVCEGLIDYRAPE